MEFHDYNMVSKFLFCLDLILTLVPIVVVCVEGIRPKWHIEWGKDVYMNTVSIFFAFQYVCGLLTCKSPKRFVRNFWHIGDLFSFLFWIIWMIVNPYFKLADHFDPMGFVFFRLLRIFKLHAIFDLKALREDLEIYTFSMKLAWASYGAVMRFMFWVVFFFSLLIYVFERGEYDQSDKMWVRDDEEGESPFSNL